MIRPTDPTPIIVQALVALGLICLTLAVWGQIAEKIVR
jgi:hypothetical protein